MMSHTFYTNQSGASSESNASVDSSSSSRSCSSPGKSKSSPVLLLSKYTIAVPSAIAALSNTSTKASLGMSFEPGAYDVVCGRGKGSYNRPGNKKFRALVATYIPQYMNARSKVDKSMILNSIIDKVRSFTNPDTGRPAQFVKFSKKEGGWTEIGDDLAREKVGHAMREAIAANDTGSAKQAIKEHIYTKQVDLLSQQQFLFEDLRRSGSFVQQQVGV